MQVRQLCYKSTYFVEVFWCVIKRMLLGREVCLSDLLSFPCQEVPDAPYLCTVSISQAMAALSVRNDKNLVATAQNYVPV